MKIHRGKENLYAHFVHAISLVILAIQIHFVHQPLLGAVFLPLYVLVLAWYWQQIFHGVVEAKLDKEIAYIVSMFFVCFLLGSVSAIFAVWYTLPALFATITFGMVSLITLLLHAKKSKFFRISFPQRLHPDVHPLLLALYVMLWGGAVFLLASSTQTRALHSPWQGIHSLYPFVYVLLTTLLLYTIASFKSRVVLILLVAHTLLLHLYLPLSHALPWGGDVWRMIAVEEKIVSGEVHLPVLFGAEAIWRDVGGVSIPEAFLIPNKYIYGQLWGTSALAHHTLGIDLITINKWLVPLLWSLFVPMLLYGIGRQLFRKENTAIWFAAGSLFPFTFQALGGLTLAVSLGTIMFFGYVYLFLVSLHDRRNKRLRNLLWLFTVLMVFSYTLHFLLILALHLLSWLAQKKRMKKWYYQSALWGFALFSIPALELLVGSSSFSASINLFDSFKEFVGLSTGIFYAMAIRASDILPWNVMVNHTPAQAFVPSVFTLWRWPVAIFSMLTLGTALYGWLHAKKQRPTEAWQVMRAFAVLILSGYIIGWFVLIGNRSFVRRLDAMVAFVLLVFVFAAVEQHAKKIISCTKQKIVVILFALVFAFIATMTYLSGPDMRVVSADEYGTAFHIWEQVQHDEAHCVLANEWLLLALEAISHGKLVGGGFPIDYQFGQPERSRLLTAFYHGPSPENLAEALTLTGAERCVLYDGKADFRIYP